MVTAQKCIYLFLALVLQTISEQRRVEDYSKERIDIHTTHLGKRSDKRVAVGYNKRHFFFF